MLLACMMKKINFIFICVPDFQLIRKLETKDYTRSKIIILVITFYTMGKSLLFNWFLFAKIFVENNLKQIKRCIKFKYLVKRQEKHQKSVVLYYVYQLKDNII